jgi:Flp pilus assembly protein TadG
MIVHAHRPPFAAGSRRSRGTAALEMVMVLPIILVIVIGAADLGRRLHHDNVLTNAARCGAVYGATHAVSDHTAADWIARVTDAVEQEAQHLPGYSRDRLAVTVDIHDHLDGSRRVEVGVAYPFELVIPWPGWPREITLQHRNSQRRYR